MKKKISLNMTQDFITVNEAFKKFQKFNKAKNLSKSTITYYRKRFKKFKNFLDECGIEHIHEIGSDTMEDYTLYLGENLDNNTTINTDLRAIRAFLNYATKKNNLDKVEVSMVKEKEKIKITYTDEELRELLKKPNLQNCNFSVYRTWTIVNWLMSTGNRSRTVRNIKIKDLDFKSGYIKLRKTKNRNEQIIPMSKQLNKVLTEYLQYRGGDEEDYLFPSQYDTKLTSSAFASSIRRYNLNRNISKTSAHLFRHTFAKKFIKNGGDMFRLQKILGHKSLEMVRKYVNMFGNDLKEGFEEYNPINEFKNDKETIKID